MPGLVDLDEAADGSDSKIKRAIFEHEGVTYELPHWGIVHKLISLPDGTVLQVYSWTDTEPREPREYHVFSDVAAAPVEKATTSDLRETRDGHLR